MIYFHLFRFEHTNIAVKPIESTVSTATKINTPPRLSMIYPQYKSHQFNSVSSDLKREILSVSGKKKCSYCAEELGENYFTYRLIKGRL